MNNRPVQSKKQLRIFLKQHGHILLPLLPLKEDAKYAYQHYCITTCNVLFLISMNITNYPDDVNEAYS